MNKTNNLTVANVVSEFFKALQNEANAEKRVMDTFVQMYKIDQQGVCDKLDDLKAKAKGKTASQTAKDRYKAKRTQVQNSCKRPGILKALFGEAWDKKSIRIVQKDGKFTWIEDTIEPKADEKCPEGTKNQDTSEDSPKKVVSIAQMNAERLAQSNLDELSAMDLQEAIEILVKVKAQVVKAKSK